MEIINIVKVKVDNLEEPSSISEKGPSYTIIIDINIIDVGIREEIFNDFNIFYNKI